MLPVPLNATNFMRKTYFFLDFLPKRTKTQERYDKNDMYKPRFTLHFTQQQICVCCR